MKQRGQLFLIEVIIALSVLLILVTTLFATQTFTTPVEDTNLQERGEAVLVSMRDSGQLYEYIDGANYSHYTLGVDIWDLEDQNVTKIDTKKNIEASLPLIANFRMITKRYTNGIWDQIDVLNFETALPSGYDISIVEMYIPGYNGIYAQFTIKLYIWFEVEI